MKPRSGRIFSLSLSSVLLLFSGAERPRLFISKEFSGRWVNDGRRFVLNSPANTFRLNENAKLVMVSFRTGSSFESYLINNPDTFTYYTPINSNYGRAILKVATPKDRDELAAQAHEDISACGGLEDFDLNLPLIALSEAASPALATTAKSSALTTMLDQVSSSNISTTVTSLQNLGTRYHAGTSPNAATDAINTLWQSNTPSGGTVTQVSHLTSKSTAQKSLVLKLSGTSDTSKTVVLGAHLDSINRSDQTAAPGADDNATGIAALTEILRILKASGATFARNVEFHAYAAEEVGLLGSSDIAANTLAAGTNVTGMLQMDMIGYSGTANDQTLHLITTDTSPVLTRHLKDLASLYLGGTWKTGLLAAGTSDHKSWTNLGFHAAFAFENPTNYNQALHSTSDTTARLDFALASRFTKLALAFLAHEAGLAAAVADGAAAWTTQVATSDAIKLSVSQSSGGGYRIAGAINESTAAASAEFCKVAAGAEYGCQSMMTDTTLAKQKSGKIFFATTEDVTIADSDLWRMNIYAASGSLVATRTVKLRKN
jgi:leucyl aminopeptidase